MTNEVIVGNYSSFFDIKGRFDRHRKKIPIEQSYVNRKIRSFLIVL